MYRAQGQNINDKHFEVIIRKMMSKVQIIRPGDSEHLPMDMSDRMEVRQMNEKSCVRKGNNLPDSLKYCWALQKLP